MIDNKEVNRILEILENMEDEQLSASLLMEFNDVSKERGQLLMNLDKNLSHDEWKIMCDDAQKKVDEVVERILSLG